MKRAILLVLVLLVASRAYGISVKEYEAMKGLTGSAAREINEYFDVYASGLGAGFVEVNTNLISKGLPPLLCIPSNVDVGHLDFREIIDESIKNQSVRLGRDSSIARFLFYALVRRFPCREIGD